MNLYLFFWLLPLISLSWLNYKLGGKDCLYPAFIFSCVWLCSFTGYLMSPIHFNNVSSGTMLLLLWSELLFSFTCWLTCRPISKGGGKAKWQAGTPYIVLFWCSFIIGVLFIVSTVRMASNLGLNVETLVVIRASVNSLASEGKNAFGALSIAPNLTLVAALILLAENRSKKIVWTSAMLAFLCAVLTGGRTYLFRLAVGIGFILLMKSEDRRFLSVLRKLIVPLSAITLALTFQAMFSKVEYANGSQGVGDAFHLLFLYFSGNLPGLDFAINHHYFSSYLYSGQAANAYAYIPMPTNVYTVMGYYFLRFGVIGLTAAISIIGAIHGQVFFRSRTSIPWRVFCAVLMYPLCLSFFDDQYRMVMTYINIGALICLYFLAPKLRSFPSWAVGLRPKPRYKPELH